MTKLIICNWKMNLGDANSLNFLNKLNIKSNFDGQYIICPPFTSIALVNDKLKMLNSSWLLGAQDCSAFDNGARKGDISSQMLKDSGCSYVIVGHSERRMYHGEDNEMVKAKALNALQHQLIPIMCIGETEKAYSLGKTKEVLKKQLEESMPSKECVVAYEPVWAIGTGKVPKIEEIEATHQFIQSVLISLGFCDIPVVYGGSVQADNITEILDQPSVAGVLIGGASVKADSMNQIIKELSL
jgi:triosephosphate isomerase